MGEIGVKMRKGVTFMIRGCSRSIYNHPFLVGILCFLIYLYGSSPFVFSLLVSVSPVLICTALLLGTLLSFGQVNLPEIEIEERSSQETVSLKTEVSENATIVHQNDSHYVERQSSEEQSKVDEVHGGYSSDNAVPLIKARSLGNGNGEDWKETKELAGSNYKEKAEWYDGRLGDDEIVENHYSSIPQETSGKSVKSDDERSDSNSFDSERVNVDSLDSPPRSPWKRVDEREEEVEEDAEEDTGLDSGSDRAESSSPDASMADIMPMLDELHPLLDEDGSQPVNMSKNGSDPESDHSSKSSASIHEETDNEEDSEIEEDENEDGEDKGVVSGDKEEGKKSAITWTEEDEKNLMDLGSSELERNQRLENLILRRRARKNMSMVPDLNLIDLESTDFPFNIPPISTARQNPFINSHNSYENSGLPPIPGSAPSILLPRRNPFDIPYDSSEEKPNLVGDGLHEELKVFQSREPFFKRHESFNVGPSIFAQERKHTKLRPFFVPERMIGEESGYSSFQRQSSELSESKASSVPETESLGSVEDFEERRRSDEDNGPELESLPSMKEFDNAENSLEEPGHSSISEEVVEEDELQEHEPVSGIEHVYEHVGHGSQSSEDEEEASERICSRDSSSSSLSEVSERVSTDTDMRVRDANLEHPVISTQTSLESTDLRIESNVVDEVPHRDPVYDSSPPSFKKNFSSSSISSDVLAESELALPPVPVMRTVSFVDKESDMEIPESSSVHKVEEHESQVIGVIDERVCDDRNFDILDSSSEVLVEEIQGAVHSSSSSEDIHDELKSTEECNLADSVEVKHSVISGKDDMVGVSVYPSTCQLSVEHLAEKEEIIENAQSPLSDSDVYLEANEKLNVTPSAEGIAGSYFSDKPMHQRTISHLNEMEAHNIVAESSNEVRPAHESNMPELQELDHEFLSNTNSPLSPDFISIPSTTSGAASPRTYLQTVAEEADEIKEIINEGILSELDSVGDFSVKQWGSGSDELDKHVSSVEESSYVVHHAVINPVEGNAVESSIKTENSREEMEMYEADMQDSSEIQIPERCVAEHIVISDKEYSERGQESPHHSSLEEDDTPPMNINENREYQSEDIDLDFGENSVTEMSKSGVLEPRQAEMVIEETITEQEKTAISEPTQVERVIKERVIEHEKSANLEPIEAKLVIEDTVTEDSQGGTSVVVNTNQEAPVLEIGTVGYANVDKPVIENIELSDSYDHVLPLVEPREIHVASIDLHVAGPSSSEGSNVASEKVSDDNEKSIEVEEKRMDSSMDLPVVGPSFSEGTCITSEEVSGDKKEKSIEVEEQRTDSSMDLHVAESDSSEGRNDPSKQVLDDNMEKSIEVDEHKVDSSNSNVKEISVVAETSDHIVEVHDNSDSDRIRKDKRKGKASKSSKSSCSSNSSSGSSSSDSDKE